MFSKSKKTSRKCENEGFDVREGSISCSSHVDGREQAKDIVGGLWKFPELGRISEAFLCL